MVVINPITLTGADFGDEKGTLVITTVSVEKVPQLMLVGLQGSGYKQARVFDAAVHD